MSGIAGIIHFDGAPVEPGQIEKMTSAMAHRGPDGIHHWARGNAALGQCMLRTTPESLEEIQPLTNEDESLVLVMDGRVDNWEELRRELLGRGAVLRTRADAELVLRAYETWGKDCLAHIDGDFALVIWDARQKQAFCARDRMGNKPFHYQWDGKTLAFASELHPILALPWVREEPNEGMLAEFLAWDFYSRDETLWQGVMRLVAAHHMAVDHAGPRLEQYWTPELSATLSYTKDDEYIEHYRELFSDSVRRMSRTHKPLACEVSGGLDSSAVFCVAKHLSRTKRLLAPRLEGYTIAFTGDSKANELAYARTVGEYLGVTINETPPTILPLQWYADSAHHFREFPGYPNGAMSIGLRQQAAAKGSRVLLSGEWGDDLLQGSRMYYAEELAQKHWHRLRECFHQDASVVGNRVAAKWFLRYGAFPLMPQVIQRRLRRFVHYIREPKAPDEFFWLADRMRKILRQQQKRHTPTLKTPVERFCQRNLLDSLQSAFSSQIMDLLERQVAQAGIEVRHPLGDPKLVQFAFSTPERLRLRGDQPKYLHVMAMRDLMPQAVLERRTKAEFSVVFRSHLNNMKEHMTNELTGEQTAWLSRDGMTQLFNLYQDKPQFGWPLWVLWGIYGSSCVFKKDL